MVLSDDEVEELDDDNDDGDDGWETDEGGGAGDGEGDGAALTDEELALQLQSEEHHAHMLELAGFGARHSPSGAVPMRRMTVCLVEGSLLSNRRLARHAMCACVAICILSW